MPVVHLGTTYYLYDEQVVLSRNPPALLVGAAFTVTREDGSAVTPLDPQSKDPIPLLTVDPGVIPIMLLPTLKRVVSVGLLTFTKTSDEVADLLTQVQALSDRALAAEQRATTAETTATTAAASAAASAASSGGSSGYKRVRYVSGAWELLTLDAVVASGGKVTDTFVFDGPVGITPQPLPPAYRRATDKWERPGV